VDSFERFARGSRSQRFNGPEVHSLPADFVGTNYTILDADKGKSLVIINGYCSYYNNTSSLQLKMQVGFIRDGAGEVT
jgi:hypothetical protein